MNLFSLYCLLDSSVAVLVQIDGLLIIADTLQGKSIEIYFNAVGNICGAKIQTCKFHFSNLL